MYYVEDYVDSEGVMPLELIHDILAPLIVKCDFRTICVLAQVCKRWHEVCSREELWKTLTIIRFGYSNTDNWNSYFQFLHNPPKKIELYEQFRFTPKLLKNMEEYFGMKSIASYQGKMIIPILLGRNVVTSKLFNCNSGTGKTTSIIVSILQKTDLNKKCSVVMICPMRELAMCFRLHVRDIGDDTGVVAKIVGLPNTSFDGDCHIAISTSVRLLQAVEKKQFSFENVDIVFIDEIDSIGARGFERELRELVKLAPKKTQWIVTTSEWPTICEDLFGPHICHLIDIEYL